MKKRLHLWAITFKTFLLLLLLTTAAVQSQTIRYVTAAGTGNGSTWATASGDIQAMLNASSAGDQVWVAAGTYKPNRKTDALETVTPNDRNNSFVLKRDVKLYGSFAGVETTLAERILPTGGNYTTILSGDFNGDDVVTESGATLAFTGNAENAYHVVVASGTAADPFTSATVLDGFTVTGGHANAVNGVPDYPVTGGTAITNGMAGGIHNRYSSVVYSNLNITKNSSRLYGGAYMGNAGTATFVNTQFTNNNGNSSAGGIYLVAGISGTFTNVLFAGNRGGGMTTYGGTFFFTNCTFTNNNSGLGAACYLLQSTVTFRNSVIKGNTPASSTMIIYNYQSTVNFRNSLVEGPTGTTNVNNDNILNTTDPMYNNPAAGDYTLNPDSPLINAGSNTYFATGQTPDLSAIITDAAGNPRIQDVTIDIGAFEYTPCNVPLPLAVAQSACSTATIADLQVTLADGATAKWYASATATTALSNTTTVTATTYYVSQTIGACESNRVPVVVTVLAATPQGAATQTYNDGETLADLEVTVTAPAQLVWYSDAELTTILPATTALVHNTTYYAIAVEGACGSIALAVTVSDLAATTDATGRAKITYHPNPVSDYLTISAAANINAVTVYNMLGQEVMAQSLNTADVNLDLQRLESGTYIVKAESDLGSKVFRIVKR